MLLYRMIALLISGIYLIPCHSEEIRCPDPIQTSEFERANTSTGELICYANQIRKLPSNELRDEINKLESKPSQQRSFDDSIKLALLLSHSNVPSRNDRRALDVLTTINSKNSAEVEFIEFLSSLLEERIARCHQTLCDETVKEEKDTLLHKQTKLKSELKEERKHRKELQEQLDALMELEESINERETPDNFEQ